MNLIEIYPVDDEMNLLATAVKLLNEFKIMGFVRRQGFVELVMDCKPEYQTFENMQKLNNFWAGRVKDKNLNDDLQTVIDKLKTS